MALHPTGLGKGLDALIRETQEARDDGDIKSLPIDDIFPNPRQPRRSFSEKALAELAESIKSQGLLQPLLVRPFGPSKPDKYEIVAGERRWRASKLAGLKKIPVMIRVLSAQDTLAAALIENLQREDLNPLEEALGMQALREEFGLSQDDIAQKLGKSRSAIANSLRLLSLPESMRPLLAEGKLSAGHARTLLSVNDPKSQEYLKNLILENHLSVREAEGLAASWKETGKFELTGLSGKPAAEEPQADVGEEKQQDHDEDKTGAEAEAVLSSADGAQRKNKPQSARILEIQNRIGQIFHVPVKVTGKEDKGRISFSYSSREELENLLERLTHLVLEGEQRIALPARESNMLDASQHKKLASARHEALSTPDRTSLAGASNPALKNAEHAVLEGSHRTALHSTENTPLQHRQSEVLSHRKQEALSGVKQEVLESEAQMEARAMNKREDAPAASEAAGKTEENAIDEQQGKNA